MIGADQAAAFADLTSKDVYKRCRAAVLLSVEVMVRMKLLPADLDLSRVTASPCRDPKQGEMSTNAAMIIAQQTGEDAMALASKLAAVMEEVLPMVMGASS